MLRLTLHGMPRFEAGATLELWRHHLEQSRRENNPVMVVAEAVWSTVVHLMWRLTFGPPSALLPGVALLFAGLGSAMIAITRPNNMVADLTVFAAATVLGTVLVRHPRIQPRTPLAIGAGLCVPVLWAYSASIAADIWAPSDWFIVGGCAVIGLGLALVSIGASGLAIVDFERGRTWGFGLAAFGAGSIAVAELEWLLRSPSSTLFIAKALTAAGTLAIAFTAWRIREIPQDDEMPFPFGDQTNSVAA